jgi:hypothetical protein
LVIIGTKSDLPRGLDEENLLEELGVTDNTSKQVKRKRKNIYFYIKNFFS